MVQKYNPDYVMHAARFAPFARENEHGEFVKFSDYEVLKAERDALAVENAALKDVLENICCRDNEPEYHDCGMGCGLEDRGIIDRYAAMAHGWESAMERVYEEVIPFIEDLPETPATDAALAAIRKESHIAGIQAAADRIGVISLKYKPGQKQELIKAIGREVFQYANELREAK